MEPKITYIRNRKNFPVACLAYSYDKKSTELVYGVAVHNPTDHYDRKLAVKLATDRFRAKNNGPGGEISGAIFVQGCEPTLSNALNLVMYDIKNQKEFPLLLRTAASQYLKHKRA